MEFGAQKRASRISRWSKVDVLNMNTHIPVSKISNTIQKLPKNLKSIFLEKWELWKLSTCIKKQDFLHCFLHLMFKNLYFEYGFFIWCSKFLIFYVIFVAIRNWSVKKSDEALDLGCFGRRSAPLGVASFYNPPQAPPVTPPPPPQPPQHQPPSDDHPPNDNFIQISG